ncbi:hypothetical protein GRI40_07135 [Altererythrobacter aerius]|uniref:Helix-hairpin-helix domain-containing protein n=1 Tax=Tsuneonella aeria TaxID=1837929 RepID=A0A6I4TD58_9SPHN|nr:hypothetical protein [Tsuneonella aeria]MXO74993.1 hypothetical protein [Tsuneonella aeria]
MRKIVTLTAGMMASVALAACSQADTAAHSDAATGATAAASSDAAATAAATASAAVLDANTATEEQLAAAPGMTPQRAAAVVAGRPYAGAAALNAKLLETGSQAEASQVLNGVFVPVNLNTASREDIALIPGMTDRMIGEFLEYRPYEDMAEFDREIGKYVDATEVARFRNYVTL